MDYYPRRQIQNSSRRKLEEFPSSNAMQYSAPTSSSIYSMDSTCSTLVGSDYHAPVSTPMSYTSSSDSNSSGYTVSSTDSAACPRFTSDYMPMPPSSYSNTDSLHNSFNYQATTASSYSKTDSLQDSFDDEATMSTIHRTSTPPMGSPRSKKRAAERSNDRFICLFPGCPSNFSRPADLSRHQTTVHLKHMHLIDCPMPHCSRKADHGFTRQDHLNEHLRKFHCQDINKRQAPRTHKSPSLSN